MSYRFHGQRPDEEVVLFAHAHPLRLLPDLLIAASALLLAPLVFAVAGNGLALSLTILTALAAAGLKGGSAIYRWKSTTFLLTTDRAVLFARPTLLRSEFGECKLRDVKQVSHEVRGLLGNLAGFGDITLATGTLKPLVLLGMPDPYDLQQEIKGSTARRAYDSLD